MKTRFCSIAWALPLTTLLFLSGPRLSAADAPASPGAESVERLIAELKTIADLVRQLDDSNFQKRQHATEQLQRMGKPAIEPLQKVLESKPSLEVSTRVSNILRAIRKQMRKEGKLHTRLAQLVNLDKGIEMNTPLKDALDFLGDRHDLNILVASDAFAAIGVQKVGEQPVSLPKMVGVSLRQVLDRLVKQIKGDEYRGSFLVRGDYIEVTTTKVSNPRHWIGDGREDIPNVNLEFEREPLEEALIQLSEATGISIVVDERVGASSQKAVTASLTNVPLDTAVRLLADMAGLKLVLMDHVLYVTTKDNARELEAEQRMQDERKRAAPKKEEPAGK